MCFTTKIGNLSWKSLGVWEYLKIAIVTVMVSYRCVITIYKSLFKNWHNHTILLVKTIKLPKFWNIINRSCTLQPNKIVYNYNNSNNFDSKFLPQKWQNHVSEEIFVCLNNILVDYLFYGIMKKVEMMVLLNALYRKNIFFSKIIAICIRLNEI